MEVLSCPNHEAEFYLESTAWDIETAVVLWLENNDAPDHIHTRGGSGGGGGFGAVMGRSVANPYNSLYGTSSSAAAAGAAAVATPSGNSKRSFAKRWVRREVHIEGLPIEWMAKVSAHEGVIYFVHRVTGKSQRTVPPGFADLPSETTTTSKTLSSEQDSEKEMSTSATGADDEHEGQQESEDVDKMNEEEETEVTDFTEEGAGTPPKENTFASSSSNVDVSRSLWRQSTLSAAGLSENERMEDYAVMASLYAQQEEQQRLLDQLQQQRQAAAGSVAAEGGMDGVEDSSTKSVMGSEVAAEDMDEDVHEDDDI
jgi:hypothetical protein